MNQSKVLKQRTSRATALCFLLQSWHSRPSSDQSEDRVLSWLRNSLYLKMVDTSKMLNLYAASELKTSRTLAFPSLSTSIAWTKEGSEPLSVSVEKGAVSGWDPRPSLNFRNCSARTESLICCEAVNDLLQRHCKNPCDMYQKITWTQVQ